MNRIHRNDPCSCGSGKKYRKCCGTNRVVAFDQIIDEEVSGLQQKLLNFALTSHTKELYKLIKSWPTGNPDDETLNDDLENLVKIHMIGWLIFSKTLKNGKTVAEDFLHKFQSSIKRPLLRKIVATWLDYKPIAATVQSVSDDGNTVVLKNIYNDEQYNVRAVMEHKDKFIKDQVLAAILVPYQDIHAFFLYSFYANIESSETIQNELIELYKESKMEDANEFVKSNFPAVLERIINVNGIEEMLSELEWENEEQVKVANEFQIAMKDFGFPLEVIQTGILYWNNYCQMKSPKIQDEKIYVAVLHYLFADLIKDCFYITQKEIADIYGVSISTISNHYQEIQEVLQEDLDEIRRELVRLHDDNTYEVSKKRDIDGFEIR